MLRCTSMTAPVHYLYLFADPCSASHIILYKSFTNREYQWNHRVLLVKSRNYKHTLAEIH